MGSKIYGYVRVSTREQNEARQVIALKAARRVQVCHKTFLRWVREEK